VNPYTEYLKSLYRVPEILIWSLYRVRESLIRSTRYPYTECLYPLYRARESVIIAYTEYRQRALGRKTRSLPLIALTLPAFTLHFDATALAITPDPLDH
jgi:hypothetical protein